MAGMHYAESCSMTHAQAKCKLDHAQAMHLLSSKMVCVGIEIQLVQDCRNMLMLRNMLMCVGTTQCVTYRPQSLPTLL